MRILVFGAGALGSLVGGFLSQKHDVTLVARIGHVTAIRKGGLKITGKTSLVVRPRCIQKIEKGLNPELIILTTKSYDTEGAMQELEAYHHASIFLSLQNGLNNVETMARYADRVAGGVTSHGVTLLGNGEILHAGSGETIIGNFKNMEPHALEEIAEVFNSVGIETSIAVDIMKEIWTKTIVNCCINPITAITGQRNGYLLEVPQLEALLERICQEAAEVARACGMGLSLQEVKERTKKIARLTSENKSSMLQDVEKGRRTEIDAINGAIVKLAHEKGLSAPVNATLVALVKAIEKRALASYQKSRG